MIVVAAPINLFWTFLFSFFVLLLPLSGEEPSSMLSLFTPPKEWVLVDSSFLAPHVKVGFFVKSKKEFCPSINLSEEKTALPPLEYLKAVQKIHQTNIHNRWRNLGTLHTKEGDAFLTSIDTENSLGKIRLLQSILVKEGVAYILTAAALQEEFGMYHKEFLKSFKSLILVDSHVIEKKTDELLSSFLIPENKEKVFSDFIFNQCKEEGAYFHLLISRKLNEKNPILPSPKKLK